MKILDGKKLAEKILRKLKKEIKKKQLKLKLAVILVGRDPVSVIFICQKEKACQKVGIGFQLFKFPPKIDTAKLKKEIKKITEDPNNSGIVIQLPLPKNLNIQIPPEKDIEISSPAVCAVERLLKEYKISLKNKNIVLVGKGRLVGKPLAQWLSKQKVKFSIVDKFTKNISSFTKKADILISGVGKPNLIKGEMVKRGVVVIDVGTTLKGKKLVGDVDFKSVSKKAGYITPVPGGVGPLVVACLLQNLIKLKNN